jgi:hypothetical protein
MCTHRPPYCLYALFHSLCSVFTFHFITPCAFRVIQKNKMKYEWNKKKNTTISLLDEKVDERKYLISFCTLDNKTSHAIKWFNNK